MFIDYIYCLCFGKPEAEEIITDEDLIKACTFEFI